MFVRKFVPIPGTDYFKLFSNFCQEFSDTLFALSLVKIIIINVNFVVLVVYQRSYPSG